MATLKAVIRASLGFTRVRGSGFFAANERPEKPGMDLTALWNETGTAADQVNLLYVKRHAFAASTAQTIALNAAVGDDGETSNFGRIRLIAGRMHSTTDGATLSLDNAGATNPFTGFLNSAGVLTWLFAATDDTDAWFVLVAPQTSGIAVPVTAVNLRLLPSAHAFDADILIAGCAGYSLPMIASGSTLYPPTVAQV